MAKVENPRKEFHFGVFVPGLDPFLVQKAKLPDIDFDITEHGEGGVMIKTRGIEKIGKFSIDKISRTNRLDKFIWNWRNLVRSTPPSIHKRQVMVEHYGYDNITVVDRWQMNGTWPSKINGLSFDKKSSENSVNSIEFECDEFFDI